MRQETTVERPNSTFSPEPPYCCSHLLEAIVHHEGLWVRGLQLPQHHKEWVCEEVGKSGGDHEAVAGGGRQQFDPTDLEKYVLEEENGCSCKTVFGS